MYCVSSGGVWPDSWTLISCGLYCLSQWHILHAEWRLKHCAVHAVRTGDLLVIHSRTVGVLKLPAGFVRGQGRLNSLHTVLCGDVLHCCWRDLKYCVCGLFSGDIRWVGRAGVMHGLSSWCVLPFSRCSVVSFLFRWLLFHFWPVVLRAMCCWGIFVIKWRHDVLSLWCGTVLPCRMVGVPSMRGWDIQHAIRIIVYCMCRRFIQQPCWTDLLPAMRTRGVFAGWHVGMHQVLWWELHVVVESVLLWDVSSRHLLSEWCITVHKLFCRGVRHDRRCDCMLKLRGWNVLTCLWGDLKRRMHALCRWVVCFESCAGDLHPLSCRNIFLEHWSVVFGRVHTVSIWNIVSSARCSAFCYVCPVCRWHVLNSGR